MGCRNWRHIEPYSDGIARLQQRCDDGVGLLERDKELSKHLVAVVKKLEVDAIAMPALADGDIVGDEGAIFALKDFLHVGLRHGGNLVRRKRSRHG